MKQQTVQRIENLISKSLDIRNKTLDKNVLPRQWYAFFCGWKAEVLTTLETINLKKELQYENISKYNPKYKEEASVDYVIEQLKSLISMINEDKIIEKNNQKKFPLEELENIFNKFAKVAKQLSSRHNNRKTLTISDEYDVQDLLHALLLLHFDDVRDEEWTPSYAGGCERMDFLLKDLQTVIEVKKTRSSMSKKELGEELIIDIEKYKVHPDCKQLYCFIYDPDGYLGNSSAIKNDLEKTHQGFVKIFIRPEM